MGTASFSVGTYARGPSATLLRSTVKSSGAFTTSVAAANIEDAGGDVTLAAGDVIHIHADEAMRVRFGGTAATATTGHYIPAAQSRAFECHEPGTVSIIDVA